MKKRYFDTAAAATEGAWKDTPLTVEAAKEKLGIWYKVKNGGMAHNGGLYIP